MSDFSPYAINGGTILGMAEGDFALMASDTRLSENYYIHSRTCVKVYQLTDETVLACTGCHTDITALRRLVETRLKMYKHEHRTPMKTGAIAAMLSTILYHKRFLPYWVYNIVGGLDEHGKGCVYSFDPLGSYERVQYQVAGSAGHMLQPILDNQIGHKHQTGHPPPLTQDRAVRLVQDMFISGAERDIYTGDSVVVKVITSEGIQTSEFDLRRD